MKPTVHSIGQALGLSSATVSKALSNKAEISVETRQRVVEYAKEIGYFKGNTGSQRIAFVVANPNDESDTLGSMLYESMLGLRKYASRLQLEVVILAIDEKEQEKICLDDFAQLHQLAGIFITGLKTTDAYFPQLSTIKTPLVAMDIEVENPAVGCVGTNSISGGHLAVAHLSSLGHKRIGFVNGHDKAYVSRERLAGYVSAMHFHHLTYDPALLFNGDFSAESGAAAADYFAKTDATAIYFASDIMAFGAVRHFHALGISVPGDISVIGFDNLPFCKGCIPQLTSVAQDGARLGQTACALLYGLIQKVPIHNVKLEPKLVIRESTGVPKQKSSDR